MKMKEALDIIGKKQHGFMVHFEKRNGHILISDFFPDKHANEDLIPTIEEARDLADRFNRATNDDIVNIYVIDHNFRPVD